MPTAEKFMDICPLCKTDIPEEYKGANHGFCMNCAMQIFSKYKKLEKVKDYHDFYKIIHEILLKCSN
jgi:hypothetical protein